MAHRTQIMLHDAQYRRLREEARATGLSLAELVRRALDQRYGGLSRADCAQIVRETAGSWSDFEETGEDFVERMRPGTAARLRRTAR